METQGCNIESLSCSDPVKREVADYAAGLLDVLGENLLGLCVYGSLARGCYNPSTSDVDVIAVTRDNLTVPDISAVLQVHRKASIPVDAVVATDKQICADTYPTPVVFLVKPISNYRVVTVPEGSRDFLLQRQDTYEAGITLVGPNPRDLMSPVSWGLQTECLDCLLPNIVPYFKNPILMLCRIAYAWTHKKLCSKQQAGEWAELALEERWAPAIRTALAEYAGSITTADVPSSTLRDFEEYCAGYIDGLRTEDR